jgi:hypothetical protein
MTMRITPLATGVALFALGCGSDFTPEYRLEKTRVLALQADPPQPRFGESTTLRSLLYLHDNDTPVSYHWTWCPLPTVSVDGYKCAVDQAGFDSLLGSMTGQAAPSLDLGTNETATFVNVFPASTLAAICSASAGATLAASEVDAGVAGNDAGVAWDGGASTAIPDGGVATEDGGGLPDDGSVAEDDGGVAANWTAPADVSDAGTAGGMPLTKIFTCASAGFPVTVRLDFQTADMVARFEKPASAVFKVFLPIDDILQGNQNPVLGGLTLIDPDNPDPSAAQALDQAGSVTLKRKVKYKLVVDMPVSDAENYTGWTRDNLGGYVVDKKTGQHVIGDVQEILSLNWYVEAGDLGDNGGRRGGNTGFNPYAAAPQPFSKAQENYWKLPLTSDYKPGSAKIYVLVRDDRGGVGWTSATVALEPESVP